MFNIPPATVLARLLVLFIAIPVHEFAHAWMAEKMGDPTARFHKRVSLNPLDHIDPIGAFMILFFGIGFARPVPVNSFNFKTRKKGIILTSLAGPASNVILAFVCLMLAKIAIVPAVLTNIGLLEFIFDILYAMVSINLSLAVFNLLPIPPLDGWNILSQLLPPEIYWKVQNHQREMVLVVFALILLGVLNTPINLAVNGLFGLINLLTSPIDMLMKLFI